MSSASQYKTAAFGDDQKHHIPGAGSRLVQRDGWWGPHKRTHKRRLRQESTSTFCMFFYLLQVGFFNCHFPTLWINSDPTTGALELAKVKNWEWRLLLALPLCRGSLLLDKNQKVIA